MYYIISLYFPSLYLRKELTFVDIICMFKLYIGFKAFIMKESSSSSIFLFISFLSQVEKSKFSLKVSIVQLGLLVLQRFVSVSTSP